MTYKALQTQHLTAAAWKEPRLNMRLDKAAKFHAAAIRLAADMGPETALKNPKAFRSAVVKAAGFSFIGILIQPIINAILSAVLAAIMEWIKDQMGDLPTEAGAMRASAFRSELQELAREAA